MVIEPQSVLAIGAIAQFALQIGLAVFILLRGRGTPQVRLTWLIVILAVPLLGAVMYVLVGEARLGRRRVERHRRVCEQVEAKGLASVAVLSSESPQLGRARRLARLAHTVSGTGTRPGNLLRLYSETDHVVDGLIEDIDRAQASCNLLFYIWLPDVNGTRVAAALMAATRRGVRCRVLVDSHGARPFLKSHLCREIRAAGVRVAAAMPAGLLRAGVQRIDIRNHRKIAVIDGSVAWTGSQNVADAAFAIKAEFAPWVDLMVRIEGPAVQDLQVLFAEDWLLEVDEPIDAILTEPPVPLTGGVPVQVIGSGPLSHNRALVNLTQVGLLQAEREIVLTTPYFVPDETTVSAMCTAGESGVVTNLVVPARNDSPFVAAASRSYYQRLLDSGVSIYEYRAGLLHAKTVTVDSAVGVVATANMDRRSFELNFEVSVVGFDREFGSRLRAVQQSYIDESNRVEHSAWSRRPWRQKLGENAAGILAPLL